MSFWVMVNSELGCGRSIASLNIGTFKYAGQHNTEVYLLGRQICTIRVHWLPLQISNDEVDDWDSTHSDEIESIIQYEHSEAPEARGLLTTICRICCFLWQGVKKKQISPTTVRWWLWRQQIQNSSLSCWPQTKMSQVWQTGPHTPWLQGSSLRIVPKDSRIWLEALIGPHQGENADGKGVEQVVVAPENNRDDIRPLPPQPQRPQRDSRRSQQPQKRAVETSSDGIQEQPRKRHMWHESS